MCNAHRLNSKRLATNGGGRRARAAAPGRVLRVKLSDFGRGSGISCSTYRGEGDFGAFTKACTTLLAQSNFAGAKLSKC